MKAFRQVVAEKGFAAGARRMGLSPASVTRMVRDLEDHLGVRLLHRSSSRLALTAAGLSYLERVNAILADIEEAELAVSRESQAMSGSVRVLAEAGLPSQLVASAVAEFHWLNPQVLVELQVGTGQHGGVEGHDVALLHDGQSLPAGACARPLLRSRNLLCAAPAYLRRCGAPRTPAELQRHAFIRLAQPPQGSGSLHLVREADGEPADGAAGVVPALSCNDPATALHGLLAGAGIGCLCERVAEPLLCTGQLQRVLPGWLAGGTTLMLVYPSRRYMPVRTRAFVDHLLGHVARLPELPDPSAAPEPGSDPVGFGMRAAQAPCPVPPALSTP